MVLKEMNTKINIGYIFYKHAHGQYCSLNFQQIITTIEFHSLLLFLIDSSHYFIYEMMIFLVLIGILVDQ